MSNERRKPYPFDQFEGKWQRIWEEQQIFHAPNPGEKNFDPARPKFYILDMFPYPSGAGLHVGHPEGYTATDILARYKRMRGFNVLHPMGWDAFGLPAEQYAIKTGQHPAITTRENVAKFKAQLKRIGFSYDWQREINTTDPRYYKWTQWVFLQIYNSYFDPEQKKARPISELMQKLKSENENISGEELRRRVDEQRLAYVAEVPVNWCPELGTVLANEEVIDGKSEVGGFPVVRRPMRQWMLRITAYADRLIDESDGLDWPEGIKLLQRNWIGKSEGAEIEFRVAQVSNLRSEKDGKLQTCPTIRVFTTRADTLYGATYMVLAPEHSLVELIVSEDQWPEVRDYRERTARKSELERTELAKEKTGVFTGAFALNPASGERIPIWIADYVLLGYGTGAIMAVPAHDERDLEFARKFNLPIKKVVQPPGDQPATGFVGEGIAINSPVIDGLPSEEAKSKITAWLEDRGTGKRAVNYKLRDWLFSRQRYWGEPFPIVWQNEKHRTVPESELPVVSPDLDDFKPTGTGEPPLAKAREWIRYSEKATRETNTMPQWAGSCWYYLRFCDPWNDSRFVGLEAENYWAGGSAISAEERLQRELQELFVLAQMPQTLYRAVNVGPVAPEVSEKLRRIGFRPDLSNYTHVVDSDAIRHILKRHGAGRRGAQQQNGMTIADVLLIPEIVRSPDEVTAGRKTGRGRPSLLYRKRVDGYTFYLEEVLLPTRRLLAKTAYKKAAAGRRATVEAGFAHTSETFRRAQLTIAAKRDAGKSGLVDLYVGGTEHAVLHLLYARFWHKALFDLGYVSTPEPFQRLVNQGLILGEDNQKMSKSRGNVVNPDDVIDAYGADAFRCYEMFMGPLEQMKPWSMRGVEGVARFLARVWRLLMDENQAGAWVLTTRVQEIAPDKAQLKIVHATIKKVTEDIEALSFNTALAQMMVFVNAFTNAEQIPVAAARTLLVLLNPFAPHISSELWEKLGDKFSITPAEITAQPWPEHDERLLLEQEIEYIVQLNGKVRDRFRASPDASKEELEAAAFDLPKIQEVTVGKQIRRVVVVPKKLVNIVTA